MYFTKTNCVLLCESRCPCAPVCFRITLSLTRVATHNHKKKSRHVPKTAALANNCQKPPIFDTVPHIHAHAHTISEDNDIPTSPPVYRRGTSREDTGDVFSRLGAGTQDPSPGGNIKEYIGKVGRYTLK